MKRLLAVMLAGMLAGCGAAPTVPSTAPAATNPFPEVTERLRASCPWLEDADIASGISVVRGGRETGISQGQALLTLTESCAGTAPGDLGVLRDCNTCFTAIVDAVY